MYLSAAWVRYRLTVMRISVTPTHLTVIASCPANGNTYLVGPTASPSNTIPANTSAVTWNPWEWEQVPGQTPFAEATYVLKIWDERGPQATVKGGYLSPYSGTNFAMYRPAGYTAIASEWSYGRIMTFFTSGSADEAVVA